MKKIYNCPEMELLYVEMIDCLNTSEFEEQAPDNGVGGDDFIFDGFDNFF